MEAKFVHSLSTKPPQPSPTFTLSNPSATNLNQIHTRLNHRRSLSLKINAINNNSDITEPENTNVDPQPEAVEIRFRRRSISRRSKQRMEGVEIDERLLKTPKETTNVSRTTPSKKKWEEMSVGEKALELYLGEKGLLFWINKFAYASIFIIIGAWILFRFVGPALNLYQLDSPPLSPTDVLKGSS